MHSSNGVSINLSTGTNTGGDAEGDTLTGIENLYGSLNADTLIGDDQANIINGFSGADTIDGMGGNDRITIGATPVMVDGGDGNADTLIVRKGTSATLADGNFTGFERVVLQDGATADLSDSTSKLTILSQSTFKGGVTIIGTNGADRIVGGKGDDEITGGGGADIMFAGSGGDTFNDMMAGFGRDVIYNANLAMDTFNVAGMASSMSDLTFVDINGGKDTLIYGTDGHTSTSDSLVLKGLHAADVEANGQFTFQGAAPSKA